MKLIYAYKIHVKMAQRVKNLEALDIFVSAQQIVME